MAAKPRLVDFDRGAINMTDLPAGAHGETDYHGDEIEAIPRAI